MSINLRLLGALQFFLFTAFALIASPGFAQEGGNLEEIIVTATKREERLQDVPMSISVLGGDEIVSRGIESPYDIARRTAGLDYQSASGLNSQYIIRGVSMSANQGTKVDKTVMVYLDEMPITSSLNNIQANLNLYDIGRIEVLKGPQGTLFGSGTLAGTVRLISNKPQTDDFDYSLKAEIGSTGGETRKRLGGMANFPLNDSMALRVVGYMNAEPGYVTNSRTGASPADDYTEEGLRATLGWQVNDDFKMRLGYVYHNQELDDMNLFNPDVAQFERSSFKPESFPADVKYYNLTLEYDLGFATLMSSTNYLDSFSQQNNHLGGVPLPFDFGISFGNAETAKVQEIRLTSSDEGRFTWIAGWFSADRENDYKQVLHTSDAYVESKGGVIGGLVDEPGYADNAFIYGSYRKNISIEKALFAELSYDITPSLTGTVGFRKGTFEQDDERFAGGNCCWDSRDPVNFLFGVVLGGGDSFTPNPYRGDLFGTGEVDADTSKFSLAWQVNDNVNLYGLVSEGWRAPKYNGVAVQRAVSTVDPTDIVINLLSEPDSLWNYEVGMKATFLDGRMSSNISLFQIDWTEIQRQASRRSDLAGFVANGGDAEISGVEFELFGAVSEGFNVGFNATVQSGEIVSASADQQAATGSVLGASLVSPDFKASLFLEKYASIGDREVVLRGDIQHVGSIPNGMPNLVGQVGTPNPIYQMQDSYQNVNASIGWNMGDWDLQFYGENILDNDSYIFVLPDSNLSNRYGTMRPRTFGVRVTSAR